MQFKRKLRVESPPDITPLIDVVFLLLIFFMLSTTFIVKPGIKIDLPTSSAEKVTKEKEEVTVYISEKGEMFVDERPVTLTDLDVIFQEAADESLESIVIIEADKKTSHGTVVSVMDSAKKVGITKLAISTEPEKKQ